MMIEFEEVMETTRAISSETAFTEEECKAYYDLLVSLPWWSTVLEIGLQWGRSSSIALQVARVSKLYYYGVDPFVGSPEIAAAWKAMADQVGPETPKYVLLKGRSIDFFMQPAALTAKFDLILVDGDHSAKGVRTDCFITQHNVKVSGHICFHDYGRDSLPDVKTEVDIAMKNKPFVHVLTAGTLAVWRRTR